MACLLYFQYSLNPRDNFMRAGVGGFVQVDDTSADVVLDVSLQR